MLTFAKPPTPQKEIAHEASDNRRHPALVLALLIAGCDKGPSGSYQLDGPIPMGIEFKSGKAIFSMIGDNNKESDYTVSGDKITISKDPEGRPVTLTMNSDGSLTGPNGLRFVKNK